MFKILHKTNIDFQSKRHFWMGLSGAIILAGLVNILFQGGLNYSIDFTGGLAITLRSVAPAGTAPLSEEAVRKTLSGMGVQDAEVKTSRSREGEDLLIRLKAESRILTPESLIRQKLSERYPEKWRVVPNDQLNQGDLEALRSVSFVAVETGLTQDELQQVLGQVDIDAPTVVAHKTETGKDVWILSGQGRDVASKLRRELAAQYTSYRFELRSIDMVGPRVGSELRNKALLATVASWLLIILYLWWRYDLVFGIAAIIALLHDTLITVGILSFFNYEISMTVISAILTLIGFSVNDTIVIFDRIRENLKRYRDKPLKDLINESINQTLSRTIITSGTVFTVVAVLFFLGGEVLRGFSAAMLIGVIVGSYSTIYIAAPILIDYVEKSGRPLAQKMKNK